MQKYWREENPKPYRFVTARMIEDAYHGIPAWQASTGWDCLPAYLPACLAQL